MQVKPTAHHQAVQVTGSTGTNTTPPGSTSTNTTPSGSTSTNTTPPGSDILWPYPHTRKNALTAPHSEPSNAPSTDSLHHLRQQQHLYLSWMKYQTSTRFLQDPALLNCSCRRVADADHEYIRPSGYCTITLPHPYKSRSHWLPPFLLRPHTDDYTCACVEDAGREGRAGAEALTQRECHLGVHLDRKARVKRIKYRRKQNQKMSGSNQENSRRSKCASFV